MFQGTGKACTVAPGRKEQCRKQEKVAVSEQQSARRGAPGCLVLRSEHRVQLHQPLGPMSHVVPLLGLFSCLMVSEVHFRVLKINKQASQPKSFQTL